MTSTPKHSIDRPVIASYDLLERQLIAIRQVDLEAPWRWLAAG